MQTLSVEKYVHTGEIYPPGATVRVTVVATGLGGEIDETPLKVVESKSLDTVNPDYVWFTYQGLNRYDRRWGRVTETFDKEEGLSFAGDLAYIIENVISCME